MQKGMSVDQFVQKVRELDAAKDDYVVPNDRLCMAEGGSDLIIKGVGSYYMTEIAHQQMAARTRIPYAYYERCGEVPGLRACNVNEWLWKEKAKKTVRTQNGKARAILSDRFLPLDNLLVANATLPVLAANPDLIVTAAEIGEARMYLQVVFPQVKAEVVPGDVMQFGVTITNSEVGRGALDVKQFFYRLVCRNGMVGESILRRSHVGKRIEGTDEDYSLYTDETLRADMAAFGLRLRDVLSAAVQKSAVDTMIEKMRAAAGQEVRPTQFLDAVERVTKHYSFDESTAATIADRAMRDRQYTRWSIANAITAQAHDEPDPDRQYDFEVAGYDLAVMESRQFERLLTA